MEGGAGRALQPVLESARGGKGRQGTSSEGRRQERRSKACVGAGPAAERGQGRETREDWAMSRPAAAAQQRGREDRQAEKTRPRPVMTVNCGLSGARRTGKVRARLRGDG